MIGNDDVLVPLSKFDGWTLVETVTSPARLQVLRLRAPNGRESWVSLCGAFGLVGVEARELKPGHHELIRIAAAKRAQVDVDRLAMQAERRAILSESSVDDCPPQGLPRPLGVR